MEKLRVGVIGLGQRGNMLIHDVMIKLKDIAVTALCDVYEDRIEDAAKLVTDAGGAEPFKTTDYKEVITKERVDCVVIASSWNMHNEMAIYSLKQGVPCGCEVGGLETVEECFELVKAWEETKTPYMMLENCCYGRREMMALNMAKLGIFGEIIHCSGGYMHDLREEVAFGKEKRHYRLWEYLTRNCENYPTHEIGPIAKVLDINNGNRFLTLSSTASKAAGLHEYIVKNKPDDKELVNAEFAQGDIVTTVITCAGGQTVTLTLDTTLPRYYSRGFTVRGTKGMYEEATDSVFLDNKDFADKHWVKPHNNADEFAKEYEHKLWKQYIIDGVQQGHGGMDYLVLSDFFDCVRNKKPMPIDVYDAATWMCITPLSAETIKKGGTPVEFPYFKKED